MFSPFRATMLSEPLRFRIQDSCREQGFWIDIWFTQTFVEGSMLFCRIDSSHPWGRQLLIWGNLLPPSDTIVFKRFYSNIATLDFFFMHHCYSSTDILEAIVKFTFIRDMCVLVLLLPNTLYFLKLLLSILVSIEFGGGVRVLVSLVSLVLAVLLRCSCGLAFHLFLPIVTLGTLSFLLVLLERYSWVCWDI